VNPLTKKLAGSPVLVRTVPFVVFLLLTFCQDWFGEAGRYWFYLAKTIVGAWFVWSLWPAISEMRWAISWEAVAAGIFVFAFWVGLDGHYPTFGKAGAPWNPHEHFATGSALAWFFVVVRIAGSSIVVPPLEEVFFRSFLYRYIIKVDFLSVPLGKFHATAFLVTSVIFGFEHHEWLAGILCGFTYQGLVCWKNRLGDAMTAHAITNLLLGLWVVWKGAWQFW
jgi:CAAX prenyl protease-like protein